MSKIHLDRETAEAQIKKMKASGEELCAEASVRCDSQLPTAQAYLKAFDDLCALLKTYSALIERDCKQISTYIDNIDAVDKTAT